VTARLAYAPAAQSPSLPSETKNVDVPRVHRRSRPTACIYHADLVAENTGWSIDFDAWVTMQQRRALLDLETERIAQALERQGIRVRNESSVSAIHAVTGEVEEMTAWRAIRFLPAVAARDRRPLLNGMRLFIQEMGSVSKYFRYLVVTAGEPVPAFGPLRQVQRTLSRRISKWGHLARKRYDIEVLFRGTEYTRKTATQRGLEDRFDDPETPLFHVHANVLVWPHKKLPDGEWERFLKWTWSYLGSQWGDHGTLRNPTELVKYCFKPMELDGAPDEELAWLFQETRRLKIAQPMGEFAGWLAALEAAGQKVVRRRDSDGDRGRLVRSAKARRLDHSPDPDATTSEDAAAERPSSGSGGIKNQVLGVALPQWRNTPWAEPVVLVRNYDPAANVTEAARDRLRSIEVEKSEALRDWRAAGAPEPQEALEIARKLLRDAAAAESTDRERAAARSLYSPQESANCPAGTGAELLLLGELDPGGGRRTPAKVIRLADHLRSPRETPAPLAEMVELAS